MTTNQAEQDEQPNTQFALEAVSEERDQARANLEAADKYGKSLENHIERLQQERDQATYNVAEARADYKRAIAKVDELIARLSARSDERDQARQETENYKAGYKAARTVEEALRSQVAAYNAANADLLANLKAMVAAANRADVKMRDQETYAALPEARAAIARAERSRVSEAFTRKDKANMTKDKSSAFGSHYNMYRLPYAAYAYNPTLREWEVFVTDDEGTLQDLVERYNTRADAREHAERISKAEKGGQP